MQVFSFDQYADRGRESLERFLNDCLDLARRKGRAQVASISLRVGPIDPLAVLESIFEPSEWHFYMEKGAEDRAVAGADEVVSCRLDGPRRFERAKAFVADVLDNTIAIGDLDAPFSGPHFFCGFSFFDSPGDDSPFPGAALFLPRWQVARSGGMHCAVANVKIDPGGKVGPLAEKVWRAHQRFSAFPYGGSAAGLQEENGGLSHLREPSDTFGRDRKTFEAAVNRALKDIETGGYRKIVLARAREVACERALSPLQSLNDLRMRYPFCYNYSLANGRGQSFIGASPERLVRVGGGRLETEALAGSAARGRTASEDARFAGELRADPKDWREHAFVLDSIVRRLKALGLEPEWAKEPGLLCLPNVQHLRTPVEAAAALHHVLDLVACLHPTPAVGGSPREKVRDVIPELETFDRGLYGGPIGWINARGEGDFTVAIRSALIDGHSARVFAGAGIVEGSNPEKEWLETEMKLRPLLEALR